MTSSSNGPKLSALVVAHNEEAELPDCLASVRFADEVVVVLDKCTDGSKAIATAVADRIVEGSWDIEGPRRHAGIDACTGDWIFEVDADERVPEALAAEIRETIATAAPGYFVVPFDNYIGKRLVRYGWGAYIGVSAAPRLFTPGAKTWGPQRIHPKVQLEGPKRFLENAITHYVDRDISDAIQRLDRYTSARAADLRAAGDIGSYRENVRRIFSRFWKSYVARKGYKEGPYGLMLGIFAGLYPILSYLKARLDEPEDDGT